MGFAWATKSSPGPLFSLIELTNSFPFDFRIFGSFLDLIWHYSTRKKAKFRQIPFFLKIM